VRGSRKPRRAWFRWTFVIIVLACGILAAKFYEQTPEPVPASAIEPSISQPQSVRPKAFGFCDRIKSWSSLTVLSLGPETQRKCDAGQSGLN
jgi:hypothetical protein